MTERGNDDQLTKEQKADVRNKLAKVAKILTKLKHDMLEKKKENHAHLQNNDFLWRYLLQSYATLGSAKGAKGLVYKGVNYQQISYRALKKLSPNSRKGRAAKVFRTAKVRFPDKKAAGIVLCFNKVESLGGPTAAKKKLLCSEGRDAKIVFLKQFMLIGDKYARNLMMDVYHEEFRDYIAIDSRITNISEKWNIPTKPYEDCEIFYRSVAKKAGIDCWTLDRLMFEFEKVFYPPIY